MEVRGLFVHVKWLHRVAGGDSGALVGPFMHVGTYQPLGYDPTNASMTVTLHNSNGTWLAYFQDNTNGILRSYQIPNVPNKPVSCSLSSRIFMEASNDNCANYTQFNQIDFNNFKYLDWAGNPTSQNPITTNALVPPNLQSCIGIDQSLDKIYHL
ncbi:MAG: hypothetical protein HMLIMOIP_002315 [Candidatus Nitrosomirales archaeon]|jgi:hypothetical protein